MNIHDFSSLCHSREECLRVLFTEKHMQYGTDEDVFQNNTNAAKLAGLSPERFLMTNVAKHVAVLVDYAKAIETAGGVLSASELSMWRESMDDISLWMFILNGLLEEHFQRDLEPLVVCKTCNDTGRVKDFGDDLGSVCGAAFEIAGATKTCPDCQKRLAENGT